jgi:iron(III) transport system permease protein
VLVSTFGEMTVTDVFQLRTYAEELYTGFALDDLEAGPLGVMPGLIIVGWLTAAALVVCLRVLPQRGLTRMQPPRLYRLGCWQYPAVIFVTLTLVVLVGVPLLSLVYQAGVAVTGPEDARQPTWSALHACYMVVVSVKANARELFWTVTIAALVAVAAIAVAVPLGWSARRGGLWLVPLLAVTAFCLALPAPLIGMGLIEALSQPGSTVLTFLRDRTVFAPWAAQLIRSLPLTLLIVWQALRTVPRETIELATIDGAGPGTRLTRVVLPQRSAALWAAALVAFAIAAGDAAATASDMVIPPGIDLLSRRIAGLLHASVTDLVAGICLVNWGLFVGIAMLVVWLLSRQHRRSTVGFDEL